MICSRLKLLRLLDTSYALLFYLAFLTLSTDTVYVHGSNIFIAYVSDHFP